MPTPEPAEIARAVFDAWNRDDLDAFLATMDPEVEFETAGVFPDFDDVYRGHAGLAEWWRTIHEPWQALRIELAGLTVEPIGLIAEYRLRGEGGSSGASADVRFFAAIRYRDGLVTRIAVRRRLEEGLEALRGWTAGA